MPLVALPDPYHRRPAAPMHGWSAIDAGEEFLDAVHCSR
jgi:hypothetical protein